MKAKVRVVCRESCLHTRQIEEHTYEGESIVP